MKIISIIEEQSIFGFTGKINLLQQSNHQYLGAIYLMGGNIVNTNFGSLSGTKALMNFLLEAVENEANYKYVVEPEVITTEMKIFNYSYTDLRNKLEILIKKSQQASKLRPPANIRLIIRGDFVLQGPNITPKEFDLMCTISDYSKVSDIYANCPLHQFEITNGLIALRQKKAIKVISAS